MTITAVFDKSGLQRGFYTRDLSKIDVSLYLLLCRQLEIEFFEAVTVDDHHPGLFRVCGVDEHALCHSGITPRRAAAAARNSAGGAIPCVRKPATPELTPSWNDCISTTVNLVRGRLRVPTIHVAPRSGPARRHTRRRSCGLTSRCPCPARYPAGGRRFFASTNVYWQRPRHNAFVRTATTARPARAETYLE